MDKKRLIVSEMCKSPYLNDWILELKDEESLFSLNNIKPCVKVDETHIRSSFWEGLNILEEYSKRNNFDKKIDSFIIKLLNSCINKYVNDPETDKKKRLDSSYTILDSLCRIFTSRARYINECKFVDFVHIYLSSPYAYPFSLVLNLSLLNLDNVDSFKIFQVYSLLADANVEGAYEYVTGESIERAIKKAPNDFYSFSKDRLIRAKNLYFDMGAFYNYPDEPMFTGKKEAIFVDWIRISSKYIAIDFLTNEISMMIDSEKEYVKKCALCLINLNFEKISNLFYKNISTFFNDRVYYSDLCLLLDKNIKNISNDGKINLVINAIREDEWMTNELSNHLSGILKSNGIDVFPYKPEDKKTLSRIKSINKHVYIVENPIQDEKEDLSRQFDKVDSFDGAVKIFNSNLNGSRYFTDVLCSTFLDYLEKKKNVELFMNEIGNFNYELIISAIHRYEDNSDREKKLLFSIVNNEKCRKEGKIFSSVLFATDKLLRNGFVDSAYEVLRKMDYKRIKPECEVNGDSFVTNLINDNFFLFLSMYCFIGTKHNDAFEDIKKIIEYGRKNFCQFKFKAILAYALKDIVFTNKEYGYGLIPYAFDNYYDGYYPSYLSYFISNDNNFETMNKIVQRDDFKSFISLQSANSDTKNAQTISACRIFQMYFFGEYDFTEIIESFFESNNINAVTQNAEMMSYWLTEKNFDNEKLNNVMAALNNHLDDILKTQNLEVDQLIRYLAKLEISANDSIPLIWKIIIRLFDGFGHYFADEVYDLLKKYKDSEITYVSQIMKKYVDSYSEYQTYEETFEKTLMLFKDDEKYQGQYRRWMNKITKINPNFKI